MNGNRNIWSTVDDDVMVREWLGHRARLPYRGPVVPLFCRTDDGHVCAQQMSPRPQYPLDHRAFSPVWLGTRRLALLRLRRALEHRVAPTVAPCVLQSAT